MRAAPIFSLLTALIFSSAALSAQTLSTTKPAVLGGQTQGLAACPVHFSAERYGLAATVRKTANGEEGSSAQPLRISFATADAGQILRAVVVVYGANPASQFLPVGQDQAGQSQKNSVRSETFVLTQSNGRFEPAEQVVAESVPLVQRIEITEIEFKNGSVWRPSRQARCSIAPSPFVLVNATAQ